MLRFLRRDTRCFSGSLLSVGGLRRRERPERRKADRKVLGLDLEDGLRRSQAAEPMRPKAAESHARRQGPTDGVASGRREQDLTAVRR